MWSDSEDSSSYGSEDEGYDEEYEEAIDLSPVTEAQNFQDAPAGALMLMKDKSSLHVLHHAEEECVTIKSNLIPKMLVEGYVSNKDEIPTMIRVVQFVLKETGVLSFLRERMVAQMENTMNPTIFIDWIKVVLMLMGYNISATSYFKDSLGCFKMVASPEFTENSFAKLTSYIDKRDAKINGFYTVDPSIPKFINKIDLFYSGLVARRGMLVCIDDDVASDRTAAVTELFGFMDVTIPNKRRGIDITRAVSVGNNIPIGTALKEKNLNKKKSEKGEGNIILSSLKPLFESLDLKGIKVPDSDLHVSFDRGYSKMGVLREIADRGVFFSVTLQKQQGIPFVYGKFQSRTPGCERINEKGPSLISWKSLKVNNGGAGKLYFMAHRENNNPHLMVTNIESLGSSFF
jgi:hypothetical protein